MTVQILAAVYDERTPAETARDDLLTLGIGSGDVAIHTAVAPGVGSPADAPAGGNEAGGLGFPEADWHLYSEALRRGGCLLVARVPGDQAGRAVAMLERLDPVDLEERADMWALSGWQSYVPGVGPAGGAAPEPAHPEPALAHAPLPAAEDPARVGALGDSIAYGAQPGGHGTVRQRVRAYHRIGDCGVT